MTDEKTQQPIGVVSDLNNELGFKVAIEPKTSINRIFDDVKEQF